MAEPKESREQSGVRAWVLGAVVAGLSFVFLQRFVLVELLVRRLLFPAILALAEAVAIVSIGLVARRFIDRLTNDVEDEAAPARLAFDFLVGYPLFGAICFVVALFTTHRIAMSAVLLAGILLGAFVLRTARFGWRTISVDATPLPVASIALLALAALIVSLNAQMPPVSLDELAYHLTVPKTWVLEGRAVELPLLSHSYFPLGIEAADLPFLSLLGNDGGIASHLLHALAAFAVIAIVFGWASRRASVRTVLLIVLAIATTPALLVTGGWSLNDWAIAGACAALFISLHERIETHDGHRGSGGAVALSLAAGLLTKYTFVPVAGVLIVAYILAARRASRNDVVALVTGCVLGSVFYLRNLVLTGNPFAPFFGSDAPAVTRYRYAGSFGETFRGYVFDGRFIDESLGVLLFAIAVAFVLLARHVARERFLLWSGVGGLLVAVALFATAPSSRILLPALIVVALASVVAIDRFLEESAVTATTASIVVVALAACQLFLCGAYVALQKPFDLLGGRLSDDELVAAVRPSYPDIQFADGNLPENSRSLVLGMNELFWFSHRVRGGGNFDGPRIARLLDGDAPAVSARLRAMGLTHIVIFPEGLRGDAADIKHRERETSLTSAEDAALRDVLGASSLVASSPRVAVYSLK